MQGFSCDLFSTWTVSTSFIIFVVFFIMWSIKQAVWDCKTVIKGWNKNLVFDMICVLNLYPVYFYFRLMVAYQDVKIHKTCKVKLNTVDQYTLNQKVNFYIKCRTETICPLIGYQSLSVGQSAGWSTTLVKTEISQQTLDGLPWTLQTFLAFSLYSLFQQTSWSLSFCLEIYYWWCVWYTSFCMIGLGGPLSKRDVVLTGIFSSIKPLLEN